MLLKNKICFFIAMFLMIFSSFSWAQNMPQDSHPMMDSTATQMQAQALIKSSEAMINMCNMMMEKEMAARPWILTASIIFGILIFLALLLFVILEVLWIKFWARKLRRE